MIAPGVAAGSPAVNRPPCVTAGRRGTRATPMTLLGHPAGLFLLFLVEMWERFSYYGMRGLLVLYLVQSTHPRPDATGFINPGRGWSRGDASLLYGWYTGLAYLLPIVGGWIADRLLGTHRSMVITSPRPRPSATSRSSWACGSSRPSSRTWAAGSSHRRSRRSSAARSRSRGIWADRRTSSCSSWCRRGLPVCSSSSWLRDSAGSREESFDAERADLRLRGWLDGPGAGCRRCRTRRSASRAEEDAPPVAVDGHERARAQARQPPGVPRAGDDVGPGAMVEERPERAFRYEIVARAETAALREHIVAGEGAAILAQEHDRPVEVEGQGLAEGLEADDRGAGLDVGGELPG